MTANRPRVRRTGALTRSSIRRAGSPHGTREGPPGWRQRLVGPTAWLTGILLTVVTVTFQDVLVSTAKTLLPFDRLPDAVSPQGAIEVVEVRNVKEGGTYVVPGDDGDFVDVLNSGVLLAERADVVDVGEAQWMVTLQGRASQQVRITDIVPEVEGGTCGSPLAGSFVYAPTQGSADVIPLRVAIDERTPRLTVYSEGDGKDAEPFFTGPHARHITLKQNESEAFVFVATSERGHCRWRYRIHYQLGGSTAETVLSRPGDRPFELTGPLPDARGYGVVYYPSFLCPSPPDVTAGWSTATGGEYARARRDGDEVPCPKG